MIGSELSEPFTYAARAVIEQQSAVVHEQDSVCYGKDLLEPMLDKYDRKTELAVQSAQSCDKIGCGYRVKLTGRLVENKHARLHDHYRGKIEQLLLTSRQLVGAAAKPVLNAEIARHLADPAAYNGSRQSETLETESKLVPYTVGDYLIIRILKHIADLGGGAALIQAV